MPHQTPTTLIALPLAIALLHAAALAQQLWVSELSARDNLTETISCCILHSASHSSIIVAGSTQAALTPSSNAGGFDAYIAAYDLEGAQEHLVQFGTDEDDFATRLLQNDDSGDLVVAGVSGSSTIFLTSYAVRGNAGPRGGLESRFYEAYSNPAGQNITFIDTKTIQPSLAGFSITAYVACGASRSTSAREYLNTLQCMAVTEGGTVMYRDTKVMAEGLDVLFGAYAMASTDDRIYIAGELSQVGCDSCFGDYFLWGYDGVTFTETAVAEIGFRVGFFLHAEPRSLSITDRVLYVTGQFQGTSNPEIPQVSEDTFMFATSYDENGTILATSQLSSFSERLDTNIQNKALSPTGDDEFVMVTVGNRLRQAGAVPRFGITFEILVGAALRAGNSPKQVSVPNSLNETLAGFDLLGRTDALIWGQYYTSPSDGDVCRTDDNHEMVVVTRIDDATGIRWTSTFGSECDEVVTGAVAVGSSFYVTGSTGGSLIGGSNADGLRQTFLLRGNIETGELPVMEMSCACAATPLPTDGNSDCVNNVTHCTCLSDSMDCLTPNPGEEGRCEVSTCAGTLCSCDGTDLCALTSDIGPSTFEEIEEDTTTVECFFDETLYPIPVWADV